ncbi:cellulase family glycosylhydrolase [Streptomyces roseirectus]|uniref:Cellulase family glycosylhydrolase n=1 Tax=Streptomyces roseirectus TaxID=2768066 RepID=A0A7H0INZ3_9ACTN|nr:cellulase family glycosylhydrolase [Streptomyces roseirectus]QNP74509.1 cellulase family glycosylhydrolase [Streptomyces roseirectus]
MPNIRARLLAVLVVLCGFLTALGSPAGAATPVPDSLPFDNTPLTVSNGRFVDSAGREVVLRGYNVSGETKLDENKGLPFASVADARKSAAALRALGGGNSVRFLLSWAYAEPVRGQTDAAYLSAATAQIGAFLDAGIRVYPDFHQDLYSRYLFNPGSWYTGDGAPKWAVELGNYPRESCGICILWGQNITQNNAVTAAQYDFWHNNFGVQDSFLTTAQKVMAHLKQNLTADQFAGVVGFDPYNEPFAGRYDSGQNSRSWERDVLWPFYVKFRARMDAAGWQDKPAMVEPNLFWNGNVSKQEGGLLDVATLGSRYVFNTHFYDQKAISGILMWGNASDGQYVTDFGTVRDRAAATGTAAIVSEFGHPLNGSTAGKAPTVLKAMYQALDSRVKGANWWASPAGSGPVLSGSQWQWDIYHGRHHEYMNGNPDKLLTDADAWNDEDLSAVRLDDSGRAVLRQDGRLLDRVYPSATSGTTLAFTYEDRSRDGSNVLTWNPVPSSLPNVSSLVGSGQYSVHVWRSNGGSAPTELHLPASFPTATTTVVSDLGTVYGPAAYGSSAKIGAAAEPGGSGSRRLLLSAADSGTLHYALVTNGATTAPSAAALAAARTELSNWVAQKFG